MSLLKNNATRCAYTEACNDDIEYTCSGLFQLIAQNEFPQDLDYLVRCEQSPDKRNRDRVDIVVSYVTDSVQGMVAPTLLFIEVKRKGSGTSQIEGIETQAAKDARAYLNRFGLDGIYVMTAWGTKARVWWAYQKDRRRDDTVTLSPMFGKNQLKSKHSYVDVADEIHAWHLSYAFALIRGDTEPPEKPAELEEDNAKLDCCLGS